MQTSPTTWAPITWVVIGVGVFVALMRLPVWCADLVTGLSVLGLVALSEEHRREASNRIREALRLVGIPVTKAAREYMAMDPSDFEKALAGERKLDEWRLQMLPTEFHRVRAFLVLRDHGLPEMLQHALKIGPAVLNTKRSA